MSKYMNYASDFPGQYDCKGLEDFSVKIDEADGGFYTVDKDVIWTRVEDRNCLTNRNFL